MTSWPNQRNEGDGGSPPCSQVEHERPAAPYYDRSPTSRSNCQRNSSNQE